MARFQTLALASLWSLGTCYFPQLGEANPTLGLGPLQHLGALSASLAALIGKATPVQVGRSQVALLVEYC